MAPLSRSLVLVALVDAQSPSTCSAGRDCGSEDVTLLQSMQHLKKEMSVETVDKTLTPGEHNYVGCFVDDGARDFNFGPRAPGGVGYTYASCSQACNGYRYMALQYGGECFCDNEFGGGPYVQRDDSECAMQRQPCSSTSFLCGGGWRQAVYSLNGPPHYQATVEGIYGELDELHYGHMMLADELYFTQEYIDELAGGFLELLTELETMGREAIGENAAAIQALESSFTARLGQLHEVVAAAQRQTDENGEAIHGVFDYVLSLEERFSRGLAELHSLGLEALDAQAAATDEALAALAQEGERRLNALEEDLRGCIGDLRAMGEEAFREQQAQINSLYGHVGELHGGVATLREDLHLTHEHIEELAGGFLELLTELETMGREAIGSNTEAIQALESTFAARIRELHEVVEAGQRRSDAHEAAIEGIVEYVLSLEDAFYRDLEELHSLGLDALNAHRDETEASLAYLAEEGERRLHALEDDMRERIEELRAMGEDAFFDMQDQVEALHAHVERLDAVNDDRLTELEDRVEALEARVQFRVTVDGCSTAGSSPERAVVPDGDGTLAAVRCCWNNSPALCDSDGFDEGCQNEMTFLEAQNYCVRNGKRLCTEAEIEDRVCCGTGCNHDSRSIWVNF